MSAGQPEEDEITWGSDELPIENLDSKSTDGETRLQTLNYLYSGCDAEYIYGSISSILDGPIITEEELTCLPLIKVVPDGQYMGTKLNSVVRMMRGLLEQKVPLQEFDVRISFSLRDLLVVFSPFYQHLFCFFLPGRTFRIWSLWTTV